MAFVEESGSSIQLDTIMAPEKPTAPDREFPEGGIRAWLVVLGAYCVSFSTFGYMNAFGVYQYYYSSHFLSHETESSISWIGSIQMFFLYAGGLVGGPLFDRYGGKVIHIPALLIVLSVMMTSLCTEYYQFVLAQGIMGGVASGMLFTPVISCVSQYFQKRRATALGVAITGSSTGGVIFPIALNRMLKNPALGFGWSVRIVGFIILTMMTISVLTIENRLPHRQGSILIPSAFKRLDYVMTTAGIFFMTWGLFTPFFYLPQYAQDHGLKSNLVDYIPSILNAASVFGRMFPGFAADRIGAFNTMVIDGICTGVLLLCWPAMRSTASIIAFSVLYGFFSGGIISLMSPCFAHVTPHMNQFGTYLGMAMIILSAAGLTGTPIFGAMIHSYGSYLPSSIFSGVMMLLGSFMIGIARLHLRSGLLHKV